MNPISPIRRLQFNQTLFSLHDDSYRIYKRTHYQITHHASLSVVCNFENSVWKYDFDLTENSSSASV